MTLSDTSTALNPSDINIELEHSDASMTIKVKYYSLMMTFAMGTASIMSLGLFIFVLLYFPSSSPFLKILASLISLFLFAFGFYIALQNFKNHKKFFIDDKVLIVTYEPVQLLGIEVAWVPVEEITGFYYICETGRNVTWKLYAELREGMYADLIEFDNPIQVQFVMKELHKFLNIESKGIKRKKNEGQQICYEF